MKNIITLSLITALFFSCSKGGDKKTQLEDLKKEQASIKEKIQAIEADLAKSDTATNKSKLVATTEIQPATFKHFIEVQAKVDGDEDVMLSAQSAGSIISIAVEAGDKVSKGQVLATIDDNILRQSISEVQTQLELAVTIYNRQKNLWDQKIGSEIQFLQAKTGKEATERRMATLNQQLEMTRIKSPITGIVDVVNIKTGQTVAPGYPSIRVINLNTLKVKAEIAESYINRVKKGDEAIVFFPDENKEVNAKVDYSGNRIDPLNRTFNVEVKLHDNSGSFRPNMIAILKIVDYKNTGAFIVPLAAVQKSGEGEYVFVKVDETGKQIAKRKNIVVGTVYNGLAEIISGLGAGDHVVTTGYANLIEGDEIKQ